MSPIVYEVNVSALDEHQHLKMEMELDAECVICSQSALGGIIILVSPDGSMKGFLYRLCEKCQEMPNRMELLAAVLSPQEGETIH